MYWFEARFIKYNGDFGSRLWIGGVNARVMMRPRGPVTVDLFPPDLNGCESYLWYQILSI
jgi:hypothetical protein